MDAREMNSIADMLRNIVKTEMEGHFVRDGGQLQPPSVEQEDEAPRRRRGRPLDPETAWLDAMIVKDRITVPGGVKSQHYKLWYMLKYSHIYDPAYFADWFSGDLETREAEGLLDADEFLFLDGLRNEYGNYEKQVRRRRGAASRK